MTLEERVTYLEQGNGLLMVAVVVLCVMVIALTLLLAASLDAHWRNRL